MNVLKLQFTDVGLNLLVTAKGQGFQESVTHMAFGDGTAVASRTMTALSGLKEKVSIADYQGDGANLRMAAVFDGALEYAIREIGIYIGDTLLGVYSADPGTILGYRTPDVKVMQWVSLNIAALPTDSLIVTLGDENLNLVIDQEFAQLVTVQLNTMSRQLDQEFRLNDLEK
ncbi:MAG: hypothetical protein ACI8WB_000703 [Phenylobacterium sp.]|jgi:hypothetical protein